MQQTWTQDEDAELRRLFGLKWSASQIGNKLGKTKNSVISRARRIGVAIPKNTGAVQPMDEAMRRKVAAMVGAGRTGREIAAETGLTMSGVYSCTRRMGLTFARVIDRPPPVFSTPRAPVETVPHDGEPCAYADLDSLFLKCRWPVDGRDGEGLMLSCGAPVEAGFTYCPCHRQKARGSQDVFLRDMRQAMKATGVPA